MFCVLFVARYWKYSVSGSLWLKTVLILISKSLNYGYMWGVTRNHKITYYYQFLFLEKGYDEENTLRCSRFVDHFPRENFSPSFSFDSLPKQCNGGLIDCAGDDSFGVIQYVRGKTVPVARFQWIGYSSPLLVWQFIRVGKSFPFHPISAARQGLRIQGKVCNVDGTSHVQVGETVYTSRLYKRIISSLQV